MMAVMGARNPNATSPDATVSVTGVAGGGDGVGRLPDGRAVFVRGALPGEQVVARVGEERPRFARAEVVAVLDPSPARVEPPCPVLAAGCGGCGWQHVAPAAQRELKAAVVGDALRRIGRLGSVPDIDPGPALDTTGYRTTVHAAVVDGRAGFRRHHGHDVVAVDGDGCLVAHPLVDEILRHGRFGEAKVATVRAGVATGEQLVVLDTRATGVQVPGGVQVTDAPALAAGHRAWIHEVVAGRRFRVSAESFFQARPDGAAALAELVAGWVLEESGGASPRIADLYGGVGLLGAVLADRAAAAGSRVRVQVVEANRSSVADAEINLADLDGARVVRADVRRWRPSAFDAVVADPSRHGLGGDVVDRIVSTGAPLLVLVSCDPGSLGRDAGLLTSAGFGLAGATLVDLFPHTPHVEVVTRWRRRGPSHPPGGPAP
jgi:23S rRNA (uracil1939-C5)-methyltransferase